MLDKFSHVVLALHRGCRELPTAAFQDWAFEQVKTVLPFDSALWLTGSLDNTVHAIHSLHLHRQPMQLVADWERCSDRTVFTERVFKSPGVCLSCDTARDLGPELAAHSRRYHVAHILATTHVDPVSKLNELISIYRAEPSKSFSEEERLLQQYLVPHLAEAWRVNRMYNVMALVHSACSSDAVAAVADARGVLHLVEPGFARLLREEWPDWEGPRLPRPLAASIADKKRFIGNKHVVTLSALKDAVLLRGRKKTAVDALTPREHEVATRFASGESYKQIASFLELSPATVRNYLASIYRKLGIGDKAELVALVAE